MTTSIGEEPLDPPAPTRRRTPPKVPRPHPAPVTESAVIARFTAELADTPDDALAIVERFWRGVAVATPVIEPVPESHTERIATFLWRDADAEAVLLFVNRITDERDLPASLMRRIPGTDVWHLSYRMGSGWRASYAFLPQSRGEPAPWRDAADQVAIRAALDRGQRDPRNRDTSRNRVGVVQSVVSLPDAPEQRWLSPRHGVPWGVVLPEHLPDGRRVWVYTPPGSREAGRPIPVLLVLDGEVWVGPHDLPTTLDNLIHDSEIPPVAAVFIDSGGRDQRWTELDGEGAGAAYLVETVLPWARGHLPVSIRREDVVVVGQSLGGLAALWSAVRSPDVVGAVLSQSASLWQDAISGAIPAADLRGVRVWMEVGRHEWVLQPRHEPFARLLREAGAAVHLGEFDGGHDYACWRGGIADGLRALLSE